MTDNMIAFAGNPNAGKTTLFNTITGSRQHVGNYPGITVERKEGSVQYKDNKLNIIDLPGCYSLTAYTQEELVARQVLVDERPSLVVNVVDATKLERHLYLTVQFLELGIPVILALNMMDDVRSKGITIDIPALSQALNCPAISTVARSGEGKDQLLDQIIDTSSARAGKWKPLKLSYGPDIDPALDKMEQIIADNAFLTDRYPARWVAIKYLEGDENLHEQGEQSAETSQQLIKIADDLQVHCQKTLNSFPEAIIADYRYGFIHSLLRKGVITMPSVESRLDITDNLDKVLTHKVLGPSLMMFLLYAMFQVTFALGDYPMQLLEAIFGFLADSATAIIPEGHLQSLIVSGIIDGVGGVLSFVPLIMIMFIMIAFLEDSGYMARVAYMMDKVFRIFGLHGDG